MPYRVDAQLVVALSNSEHAGLDFATLLEQLARAAGRQIRPEDVPVSDGLEPLDDLGADAPAVGPNVRRRRREP